MKSKLNLLFTLVMAMFMTVMVSSCSSAAPDAGQEGVFIKKPLFFGDGGVDPVPAKTGLEYCAWTTDVVYVTMTPVAYNEVIDDVLSDNRTPIDVKPVIYLQVEEGKSPALIENYGEKWYDNNLKRIIIDELVAQIGEFSAADLLSNQVVIDSINRHTKAYIDNYIAKLSKNKPFPVKCLSVSLGKAKLSEMNTTAKMIQMKESQSRRFEAESAREAAERQRALADKAYMQSMNLSPEQYIQLKYIEMIEKKQGANIDVMVGPATSMWNVRR